ncbi:unnamed protein product, partial [marine sediment metagenome]
MCGGWPSLSQAAEKGSAFAAAMKSIRPNQLQKYVDHLADDALDGREAGSSGGREAGNYLVDQLER